MKTVVLVALLACGLLVACGDTEGAAPHAAAAAAATPTRTARPTAVDYAALRQQLLVPLQSLIVAVRENSPTAPQYLAQFNQAADERVLPSIAQDTSTNANRLHSVVVNTREAAARRDVAGLEAQRRALLDVR